MCVWVCVWVWVWVGVVCASCVACRVVANSWDVRACEDRFKVGGVGEGVDQGWGHELIGRGAEVHGVCVACAWGVHGTCMACAWRVHGMCVACAWRVHGTSLEES